MCGGRADPAAEYSRKLEYLKREEELIKEEELEAEAILQPSGQTLQVCHFRGRITDRAMCQHSYSTSLICCKLPFSVVTFQPQLHGNLPCIIPQF